MNEFLALRIGKVGSGFVIFLSLLTFIIIRFNPKFKSNQTTENIDIPKEENGIDDLISEEITISTFEEPTIETPTETILETPSPSEKEIVTKTENKETEDHDLGIEVHVNEEDTLSQKDIKTKLEELGDYDPKLDLSNYKIGKGEIHFVSVAKFIFAT